MQPGNRPCLDDFSEESLVELYRRFQRPLSAYFSKRVRQQADIEDLVQEVFLNLHQRAQSLDIQSMEGYIFRTAANVLTDRARRQAVRHHDRHELLDEHRLETEASSPERMLIGEQWLDQLIAALDALPEKTRRIFILRRYEGLSNAEIADQLNLTVSGVRFHIIRAKAHLARHLGSAR